MGSDEDDIEKHEKIRFDIIFEIVGYYVELFDKWKNSSEDKEKYDKMSEYMSSIYYVIFPSEMESFVSTDGWVIVNKEQDAKYKKNFQDFFLKNKKEEGRWLYELSLVLNNAEFRYFCFSIAKAKLKSGVEKKVEFNVCPFIL